MRKLLVLLAAGWIGVSLAAAWVSYDRKLPYDLMSLDRTGTTGRIGDDWLFGWGAGLTVPMWVVAAGAVLTVTATLGGGAGRFGAFVLMLVAAASIAYTVDSRHARAQLADLGGDTTASALVVSSLALAGLVVLLGFVAWLTTPRPGVR